jgi:hypothetical protein
MRNRRRIAVLAVATALLGALLSGCEAPPEPKHFGMHGDHTWDVDNTRISSSLDTEAAFGSKLTRNTLAWNVAQPTPTTYNWSKTDYVVDQAAARGMQVMFVVRAAPQWANASTNPKIIPSDPATFNAFVVNYKNFFKTAVQRYGSRVKYWEVWTEPNQTFYWQPQGLSPSSHQSRWIDMYAQLYTDTVAAVRQVDRRVELAVGSLAGISATCCILAPVFLDGLITRGVAFGQVAISAHAFRNQAPWTTIQYENNFSDIQIMRDVLVYRGRGGVNLWLTEWGWQVAGYTSPGSTTTQLWVPGNFYRLALWPNSGTVVVEGVARSYSSINRTASFDSDGNGVSEPHNLITLSAALPSAPAANTEVASAVAETTQADYVRQSIRMLRGKYVPQSGRPQQNYSYVVLATYFQNYDRTNSSSWGMYGLMHEPVPDFNRPGKWFLKGRAAAGAFLNET